MAELERNSAKHHRRADIKRIILEAVATTGLLAVALVAPNVVGAIHKIGLLPKRRQGEYVASARRQLKKDGLLIEEDGFLRLSSKGTRVLAELSPRMLLQKPKKWDGKWRVLIFDVPERRRKSRDAMRLRLRNSGFLRAQDSVWIYPYPCEEFVALLKAECRIGKDMLYLIVDTMEGDGDFRKKFGLPHHGASDTIRIDGAAGRILDTILPQTKTINIHGRKH